MKKSIILFSILFLLSFSAFSKESSFREAFKNSLQYEQSQNYKDAIRALIPIYKTKKKLYTINLRIGWLFYLSGNYANSIKHYQKAIQLAPEAVEPLIGKLLPLLAQQQYNEVELTAYKVLRIDSHNYYANLRLIVALRLQHKYDLAQSAIQKMRTLYPGDIVFIEQEALVYEQNKNYAKATELYGKLLNLDPENLTAKRYLAYQK
ncbi:MAG: tetratricopeptide repeat protein [Gammaproteobacteria bacterium]